MNATDYLVIAGILISALAGVMRGFLREAVSLAAWLIALFVAWHFSDLIEPHLGGLLAGSAVKPWAARVIIVMLIVLLGTAAGALLNHFVRLSIFSGVDRFLGFIFGLLRGLLLLGVFTLLGQVLRLDDERWWKRSLLMPYGETVANGLRTMVGEQRIPHRASRLESLQGVGVNATRIRASWGEDSRQCAAS